ncbi:hypothetical protein WJX81_001407 [Elliptochloris bilobata]|uniref:Uncharacterized protein n=1 Tax=Elliptochloris bilobata TaxID=381761 RepID=A0AAW1R1Z7_9CHLO
MPPPAPRAVPARRGPVVLDEDEWTEQLEAIIERDYFPDKAKLENKLEWLQATRTGDPLVIRQAQANIAARRAGLRTPVGATPAAAGTPGFTSMLRTPAGFARTPMATPALTPRLGVDGELHDRDGTADASTSGAAAAWERAPPLSLDRFCATHTSEDNASFAEILAASNKRRRLSKPWLFDDKDQAPGLTLEQERISDGFGTTFQPQHEFIQAPYTAKNWLYYDSSEHAALALTHSERAQLVQGPPKAIRYSNTRFTGTPAAAGIAATPGSSSASSAAGDSIRSAGKGGVGGGYARLATPSFTPGPGESPLMTWGELEGTPLRLEQEDTPVDIGGSGAGPQFRVPEVPKKDRLGREISAKASASIKRKSTASGTEHVPEQPAAASMHGRLEQLSLFDEAATSNVAGLQLCFLGTSAGHPTHIRSAAALALRKNKAIWLFECGEDTQRQLLRQPLVRPGKIDRIFLSRASAECVLGLPGMLCTASSAREMGLDASDIPIHVYGPPGLAAFIGPMLAMSDTYITMPVIVHELVDGPVPAEEMDQPQVLDRRSCLYRVRVPPDQLNPLGYYDGELSQFLSRHKRKRRHKGGDMRANLRSLDLPGPGDPGRSDLAPEEMTWTVRCDDEFVVTAVRLPAAQPSWAFVVQEADRVGRLDIVRCGQLGVPFGKRLALLKDGIPVLSDSGEEVLPGQVVGPDRPGRRLAVVGECAASAGLAAWARDCDVIVHAAASRDVPGGLAVSAAMAGATAAAAGTPQLVLTRFPPPASMAASAADAAVALAMH